MLRMVAAALFGLFILVGTIVGVATMPAHGQEPACRDLKGMITHTNATAARHPGSSGSVSLIDAPGVILMLRDRLSDIPEGTVAFFRVDLYGADGSSASALLAVDVNGCWIPGGSTGFHAVATIDSVLRPQAQP